METAKRLVSYTQSEGDWREQQAIPVIKAPNDPPPCLILPTVSHIKRSCSVSKNRPCRLILMNSISIWRSGLILSISISFVKQILCFFFFSLRRYSTFMFSLSCSKSPSNCPVEATASTWQLESLNLPLFQIYRCHFKRIAMQCFGLIVTTKRHILTEYFIDCIFIAHMYPSF